jgi:hypothetical protein
MIILPSLFNQIGEYNRDPRVSKRKFMCPASLIRGSKKRRGNPFKKDGCPLISWRLGV